MQCFYSVQNVKEGLLVLYNVRPPGRMHLTATILSYSIPYSQVIFLQRKRNTLLRIRKRDSLELNENVSAVRA